MRVSGGVRAAAAAERETNVIGFTVDFVDRIALVDGVLEGSGDRPTMSRFAEALEELAMG